jgi:hypothetical protein
MAPRRSDGQTGPPPAWEPLRAFRSWRAWLVFVAAYVLLQIPADLAADRFTDGTGFGAAVPSGVAAAVSIYTMFRFEEWRVSRARATQRPPAGLRQDLGE